MSESQQKLTIRTDAPEATRDIGRIVGHYSEPNTIITLSGNLGAGKTWLAKGIAYGLDVPDYEYVNSPAYDLVHEYEGRLKIFHLDLYRLDSLSADDLAMIQEFYHAGGVCLIEWPSRLEKYPTAYPSAYLAITLETPASDQTDIRDITMTAIGNQHQQLVERLAQKLKL